MIGSCPYCGKPSNRAHHIACPIVLLDDQQSFVGRNVLAITAIVIIIAISFLIAGVSARADDKYAAPDLSEWYASLMQPDYPKSSCCGAGDAYFADRTEECTPADPKDCALVAIITDDRPDQRTLANGEVIHRYPIANGTRISVPRSKLRKHPEPNPTDHNVIFVSISEDGYGVYCWEPVVLG